MVSTLYIVVSVSRVQILALRPAVYLIFHVGFLSVGKCRCSITRYASTTSFDTLPNSLLTVHRIVTSDGL